MARLLIVGHVPSILSLTARILEGVGHSVLPALGGALGIAAFELHGTGVAAVVMDLAMPKVDGITAFQAIRRRRQDVPFLFVSGHAEPLPEAIRTDPRVALLTKPFRMADLLTTVDQVLSLVATPAWWVPPSDFACPILRLPSPAAEGPIVPRGH